MQLPAQLLPLLFGQAARLATRRFAPLRRFPRGRRRSLPAFGAALAQISAQAIALARIEPARTLLAPPGLGLRPRRDSRQADTSQQAGQRSRQEIPAQRRYRRSGAGRARTRFAPVRLFRC